jgi:drug/metabolite transporter (DMT)-like permease
MSTTTLRTTSGLSDETRGMLLGLAGVAIFSLTLPFTRMAVAELDPSFVMVGRALAAALLAALWLWWNKSPLPPRAALLPLLMVCGGCVIGFPWLTSLAMRSLPASHGAVLVGILPLATAIWSALRGFEQPSRGFWIMAATGSTLVIGFALRQSGGSFHPADLMMFAAVVLAAIGYAEGGRLARAIGGERVICWALLMSVPILLPVLGWMRWPDLAHTSASAWAGFAYVSTMSMFTGFLFWYRGMAVGGVARVGQVQLLQPFLTLIGAWALLGEALAVANFVFAALVIVVVAIGRKMQIKR